MASFGSDTLRIYLREIGRIDRLLPEQEISYARLVRSMLALEQQKKSSRATAKAFSKWV
ncbi:hypothetical protein LC609_25470 [Nostoc sp. XA013]|nr:hypothetical protein [Nostoc sp. XA013]